MVSAVVMQEGSPLLRSGIVLFVRAQNLSFLVLLISNNSTLLEQPWFYFQVEDNDLSSTSLMTSLTRLL